MSRVVARAGDVSAGDRLGWPIDNGPIQRLLGERSARSRSNRIIARQNLTGQRSDTGKTLRVHGVKRRVVAGFRIAGLRACPESVFRLRPVSVTPVHVSPIHPALTRCVTYKSGKVDLGSDPARSIGRLIDPDGP